jgi:hypothetical protein
LTAEVDKLKKSKPKTPFPKDKTPTRPPDKSKKDTKVRKLPWEENPWMLVKPDDSTKSSKFDGKEWWWCGKHNKYGRHKPSKCKGVGYEHGGKTEKGQSLKRWQNVVNSMIEKEPGNPKILRLQVIHLYEADYNLVLAIFWAHKLVHSAEDHGLFNSNFYGGRPGMSAVEPVFLEELQVSLSYLSRTQLGIFHNNAT